MDSPQLGAKPRSALPSNLFHGTSQLSNGNLSRQTAVGAKEREKLIASIQSSNTRRHPIDLNIGHEPQTDSYESYPSEPTSQPTESPLSSAIFGVAARDPRDTTSEPAASISTPPASPFTAGPTIDFDGLSWPSLGTKARLDATPEQAEERLEKLRGAITTVLECLGEDPEREGLRGTPSRYAKAMLFFTKGYEENVRDLVNNAVFSENHDELVVVKNIEVFSLCEHHLVPFTGKMAIGYVPNGRVIGLSKLARLAEMFSRRLQVQERLTKQVALAVSEVLKPQGVAVVMESNHLCMVMRGVQKTGTTTTTSCMLGCMRSSAISREEFLSLLNRN